MNTDTASRTASSSRVRATNDIQMRAVGWRYNYFESCALSELRLRARRSGGTQSLKPLEGKGPRSQELARRARAIKTPRREVGGAWKSNMNLTWIVGLVASSLSTPTALLPDGPLDCHTSICGGRFAANMRSERAVSCFGISGDAILASTND